MMAPRSNMSQHDAPAGPLAPRGCSPSNAGLVVEMQPGAVPITRYAQMITGIAAVRLKVMIAATAIPRATRSTLRRGSLDVILDPTEDAVMFAMAAMVMK